MNPKRTSRIVGAAMAALPLVMPQPAQKPKFRVDPELVAHVAQNDVGEHVVTSGGKLGRFARKHEKAHTLDYDQFSDLDRGALRTLLGIAPDRPWWASEGDPASDTGFIPGSEIFADYYAHAQTPRIRPKKKGVLQSGGDIDGYVTPGKKKMKEFRYFMDDWARRQQLGAKQPSTVDELLASVTARMLEAKKLK